VKKLFVVLSLVASLTTALYLTSSAEDKTVNATITPLVISLEVSATTVDYGTREANAGEVVANPSQILVTNTGTVNENFLITGANSASGQWTLAATPGTNEFVHLFSQDNSNFVNMTTTAKPFRSTVAPEAEVPLYLRLNVPTTITQTAVQILPVKITAIQTTP
jgi:hypothetical protein